MKFLNSIATPIGAALKLIMYFFYVMPVETGIQNAKSKLLTATFTYWMPDPRPP
jgi:hypothetical protein